MYSFVFSKMFLYFLNLKFEQIIYNIGKINCGLSRLQKFDQFFGFCLFISIMSTLGKYHTCF